MIENCDAHIYKFTQAATASTNQTKKMITNWAQRFRASITNNYQFNRSL